VDRHLRAAASIGQALVVLVNGRLVPFDPVSFTFGIEQSVDELAKEFVVSPNGSRGYVGAHGMTNFTQVVDIRTGHCERHVSSRCVGDANRRIRFSPMGQVGPRLLD
jgi:hypothetical protein